MTIHRVTPIISISLALGLSMMLTAPVKAADRSDPMDTGFYGGVSIRDRGAESMGITLGNAGALWNHFTVSLAEDPLSRSSLLFGGYRWSNDIAVEASFNAADRYGVQPADLAAERPGVGLRFGSTASTLGELPAKIWNLDLVTSWNLDKAFALYGRVGFAQNDTVPSLGAPLPLTPDFRRLVRDGVNYGLGVRYDMNPALGLRLEYGRYGRLAGEWSNGLPESDQVTFGVQFRF